jgi:hypothetical protein
VARQAVHDVIGKEVQQTPTVSYVWMADQLGHFGMGFMITYFFGWIATALGAAVWLGVEEKWVVAGLGVFNFLIWLVKEIRDYFIEVRLAAQGKQSFPFNGHEILWNIFTALFYIGIGAVVAVAAVFDPLAGIIAFGVVLIPALPLAGWWLRRKITFQQAGLPYLYRLADFPNTVDEPTRAFIDALLSNPDRTASQHLVIAGPLSAGKSSLAVGIGTEFAFKLGIGRYTSLVKLIQSITKKREDPESVKPPPDRPAFQNDPREFQDGRTLWPWETSPLLIIDDVDDVLHLCKPAASQAEAALGPPVDQIEAVIRTHLNGLVRTLKDRRTVWVLSDGGALGQGIDPGEFRDMLIRLLSLEGGQIAVVRLQMTIREALRS